MRFLQSFFALSALVVAATALGTSAQAGSITVDLDPFTGDDVEVELRLDDDAGDGTIHGRLEVTGGVGDLRGLFFDLADSSLLADIQVIGDEVREFETGGVTNLNKGNNVNGGGTPCPCDVGISFGTPGIGRDDLQIVEFIVSHASESLDLSMLSGQYVGVRITSVGIDWYDRDGSSKLIGVVPEPGTALLVGAGLAALGHRRRSPRASQKSSTGA